MDSVQESHNEAQDMIHDTPPCHDNDDDSGPNVPDGPMTSATTSDKIEVFRPDE